MNPKIIISEDLAEQLKQNPETPQDLYGIPRLDEKLIQILSLNSQNHLKKVGRFASGQIKLKHVRFSASVSDLESVPFFNKFTSRAQGIIDTDSLMGKKVTLIGLGSVGSSLALYLAQSAVGHFTLDDSDVLSASNISRHSCDITDLARYKINAVRDLIQRRNPRASIQVSSEDFLSLGREDQADLLRGSDLVIASTDDTAVQFLVNEVCHELGIPSLYLGAYERGIAGEVLFVIPGQTPCFTCFMEFRQAYLDKTKKKERHIPYLEEDTTDFKAEPGLAIDLGYLIAVGAAYALALLLPGSERGALINPERNLILVHSGCPPQGKYKEIFQRPFDLLMAKVSRDAECPVCQRFFQGE